MIIDLTLKDNTQMKVLEQLKGTEKLISKVATKLSNGKRECNIYAMPDLGIASNITRMCGGMFTGSCYTWETDEPFIPVDSTVNVCGTTVFKLEKEITPEEFKIRVEKQIQDKSRYDWNYNSGNHFVILAKSNGKYGLEKGQYLVVHASAKEYKKENMEEGLYPVKGNWFYNDIITEYDEKSNRYLRYIRGKKAEKFYDIAKFLIKYNEDRNRYFGQKVLGNLLEKEILNIPHYGMPSINSVCIGTQWNNRLYTLLTAPGNNIYLVNPIIRENNKNKFIHNDIEMLLSPHGLGVKLINEDVDIKYIDKGMTIGNKTFYLGESVNIDVDVKIRTHNESKEIMNNTIKNVLQECPGEIKGELEQICSITKRGFKIYCKG